MFSLKRAQGSVGAAVLLAIIAFFIIIFISLIPPQERANLLEDNNDGASVAGTSGNLLTVTPGRLDYLPQKEVEHPLPVVNLFTKTESLVLAERGVATIKNGVFTEQVSDLKFSISDLEHTTKVLLSFKTAEPEGQLIINLNGQEVYNADPIAGLVKPISLPNNFLQQENVLAFEASSPGLAFWITNGARLEEIKVIADVEDIQAKKSTQSFLITETEKKNLDTMVLKFQPQCLEGEIGTLSVAINEIEIYNSVPECGIAFTPIEFSPDIVKSGQNTITFDSDEGIYLLSHLVIKSKLGQLDFPTYYFDLSLEEYEAVKNNNLRVRATLDFVDVIKNNLGDLVFNGHVRNFDTREISHQIDLSKDVVKGANSLKIRPKKTLEIRQLKVELVK